jgi:hypothetical protein
MGWVIWGSNPSRDRRFSLLQIAQSGYGIHPASSSVDTRAFSPEARQSGVRLTTQPPPSAKLKMNAMITPLPTYAFMAHRNKFTFSKK